MTNGMQTIARSLADAAQALGADAMSALAAELAARQAAPKAAPEGDFSRTTIKFSELADAWFKAQKAAPEDDLSGTSFAASRRAAPTVTATIAPGITEAKLVEVATRLALHADISSAADRIARETLADFDRNMVRAVAEAAGVSKAERSAEVEPGKVHHVAAGDRVGFIHGSPWVKGKEGGRPARASTVESDAATGKVEGITISHPLFDITIKPRG